jgi:predicted Zn-dependent peptidase
MSPALAAPSAPAEVLPLAITEMTLPNGLVVIVVPTGFPNLVSLQIPVQTGSRNEVEPGKSGFAHFFEHMMFRGTKAYPPEKYQAVLTRAGARSNAYTTDDYTNYHTTFAKEDLGYLMKNVYLQTATQNQQLGYALDSKWYGLGEFTAFLRERLAKLTREDVGRAAKKHLKARDLSVVIVTKDAEALHGALVKDAFSPIRYEAEKPKTLLDEDRIIGARKLAVRPEAIRITPVDDVFKR